MLVADVSYDEKHEIELPLLLGLKIVHWEEPRHYTVITTYYG